MNLASSASGLASMGTFRHIPSVVPATLTQNISSMGFQNTIKPLVILFKLGSVAVQILVLIRKKLNSLFKLLRPDMVIMRLVFT